MASIDTGICSICIERFSDNKVTCNECKFEVCKECCERYFLSRFTTEVSCMNCNFTWNDYLVSPKLQEHFEFVLLEKELSLIPETRQRLRERVERQMNITVAKARNKILKCINTIHQQQQKINKACNDKDILFAVEIKTNEPSLPTSFKDPNNLVFFCIKEDCKGNVKDQICNVCNTIYCMVCLQVNHKKEVHICAEQDVNTALLLRKESKNCPRCLIIVHKISGCNQMWCTQCKTKFHWKTLNIIYDNKKYHNPHHSEWVQSNAQSNKNNDLMFSSINELGENMIIESYLSMFKDKFNSMNLSLKGVYISISSLIMDRCINETEYTNLSDFLVLNLNDMLKISRYAIPNLYNKINQDPFMLNFKLRVKYINNRISDKKFKHKVYVKDKIRKGNIKRYSLILNYLTNIGSVWIDLGNLLIIQKKVVNHGQIRITTSRFNKHFNDAEYIDTFTKKVSDLTDSFIRAYVS
jgi:hypothetical protein